MQFTEHPLYLNKVAKKVKDKNKNLKNTFQPRFLRADKYSGKFKDKKIVHLGEVFPIQ